jgi:hypothetical protein
VFVGTGLDVVVSGVGVNEICVDVDAGAGVDVDDGSVATPWQAVSREKERRRGMSCFIDYYFMIGY